MRKLHGDNIEYADPRSRFISEGGGSLHVEELLEILIGSSPSRCRAGVTARRLIDLTGGSLCSLSNMSVSRLSMIEGLGANKAVVIAAALELGRRLIDERTDDRVRVIGSADIEAMFKPLLRGLPYEEVWVVHLTVNKEIIGRYRLSSGGTVNSPIDIRLVLKNALEQLACGIVMVHNHPSGNVSPSDYDMTATRRLATAAALMDIKLLDHLILGGDHCFSFAEQGAL